MARGAKAGRGRNCAKLPKMFRRGSEGVFYFRRRVARQDKWISLGRSDEELSKVAMLKVVNFHDSITALSRLEKSASS